MESGVVPGTMAITGGFAVDAYEDASRRVAHTWTVCARRLVKALPVGRETRRLALVITSEQQGKLVRGFEGQFHAETHEDGSGDAVDDADASGAFEPAGGVACAEDQQREPRHGQQAVDAGEQNAHQQG